MAPVTLVTAVSKKRIVLDTAPDPKSALATLEKHLKDVESSKWDKKFFGFEGTDTRADEMLDELRKKEIHMRMHLAGYPEQLDYTFLSWTKKFGRAEWPLFMVLSLHFNRFEIFVNWSNSRDGDCSPNIRPELPEAIACQYLSTINKLIRVYNAREDDSEISISAEFLGLMPDGARAEVIKAQKSKLFDNIFVVAEAPRWSYKETVRINDDPIVVGWVKKTQQMFLITMFDPTPFESYVAAQYAWKTS